MGMGRGGGRLGGGEIGDHVDIGIKVSLDVRAERLC
jgi:hypothetical protein